MRAWLLIVLFPLATACSPTQRRTAGFGVGLAGVGVTGGTLAMMGPPSCRQRIAPHGRCVDYAEPLPADVGFPLVLSGIGVVVLGGLIVELAGERRVRSATVVPRPDRPPDQLATLDQAEAVGMTIAHLVVLGETAHARPSKLLDVDDSRSTLHVQARRAELSNLRVRTDSDGNWRAIVACFEHDSEWRVTKLGAAPGCHVE